MKTIINFVKHLINHRPQQIVEIRFITQFQYSESLNNTIIINLN